MRQTLPAVESPVPLLSRRVQADIDPLLAGADAERDIPSTPLERAQTLCEMGRFAAAVTAAGEAITADPRRARAWCLMARAQLGQDRPAAALQAAQTASGLNPAAEGPYRLASLALEALGRDEEAAAAAARATDHAPESWRAHARLAHCLAGFRDRLAEARDCALRAVELAPEQTGPHLALGSVAIAAGDRTGATTAFCAALGVDPQCTEAHSQLSSLGGERHARSRWPSLRVTVPRLRRT